MLGLLAWHRPYERRSGNIINIFIQVVRVLSVVCILVFVEELGITQTTQTVTGVVLIAVQSALTGALAILIAVNAIIICIKENPHRKRRKEAGKNPQYPDHYTEVNAAIEKLSRDLDNLTPLDARNSLLLDPAARSNVTYVNDFKWPFVSQSSVESFNFTTEPANPYTRTAPSRPYRKSHGARGQGSLDSSESLIQHAAPFGEDNQPHGLAVSDPPAYSPGDYKGIAY